MAAKAIALGCASEKILNTPCGANILFNNVVLKNKERTFVFVGRFVEKKGPLYCIMAFHILLNRGHKAQLKMIGDGPLKDICFDYVQAHQLNEYISFLGVLNSEQIAVEFANSTCYVQHSITAQSGDQEGTPVSVMEAMLAGLPVISTKHGGIQDVVSEHCGVLVEEKDTIAMSLAMENCIHHPDVFREMGLKCKKYIQENHTLPLHLDQINQSIERL
jgi:glycosyltransferase involved in cell wall biosynthesis